MCTATFIRDQQNRIVFTTNRDEHATRPTSPPAIYQKGERQILFPRDEQAGGTWVGVNDLGVISCLMNGAEGEHEWLGTTAKKSRGQVLLESFQYSNMYELMDQSDFKQVHPFTLLLIHPTIDEIQTLKWNGQQKWIETFDSNQPHIWSAFTLYPEEQRLERSKLFNEWIKEKANHKAKSIWELHQRSQYEQGLLLKDKETVNTISTTQLILDQEKCSMTYEEVHTNISVNKFLEVKRK